jgi:tyrosine-protein kinase Etk/Wzc
MSLENDFLEVEDEFRIKDVVYPYLLQWKWYILSILIFFVIGLFYLKISTPIYNVHATILVKDEQKGNLMSEMSAFEDLGIGTTNIKSKIENEIEVLESRKLLSRVVDELDLNISYFNDNNAIPTEIFGNSPVKINFLKGDSSIYTKKEDFEVRIIDNSTFEFNVVDSPIKSIHRFGNSFNTSLGKIIITPNFQNFNHKKNKIIISISEFDDVIGYLQSNIIIEQVNKESSALTLSIDLENIEKGKAIINSLIRQHNGDVISDKNEVAKNTLDFITQRVNFLTKELSSVDQSVSSFKSHNKIFDLATNASLFFENEAENEKLVLENNTQLKLAEFIYDYINSNKNDELVPSNIGIQNPSIEKMIETINTLQLEKNKLVASSSSRNPVVQNLDVQIESIKRNLKESLLNQKKSLKIRNRELSKQTDLITSKLISAPKQEKDYKEIQRQLQIKENLYLYLLQKREETAITLAVTTSNSKIIDDAFSNGTIISPKKKVIYLICFIIALVIPTLILFIRFILDTKIHTKSDVSEIGIPYIGDIPISDNPNKLVVGKNERTSVAEAFRLLRTNINFLITNKNDGCKSIFITSTISNEGKSFIALNIAATLGLSGKKVALIGMDLRAPKIMQYLDRTISVGVTSYLINENLKLNDISIKLDQIDNVTVIPSGPIPPNPAELLMSKRVQELFREIKAEYDYIVVDTAPVGMVADTLLLNEYADMFIYVSRANYLDKKLLNVPSTLYKEGKLKNMAILLNCSDHNKNYGYGYGYGYGEKSRDLSENKKSWFKIK